METSALESLHRRYNEARGAQGRPPLAYEYFENMAVFFPCLLVVASDGVVDEEERVYVQYLARFMADPFKKQLEDRAFMKLKQDYHWELEFLMNHLGQWRGPFLEALQAHLRAFPGMKPTVLDTLYLFAEASEGTSAAEEAEIQRLATILELEEDGGHPEA
jgi:hypothetical protein